MWNGASDRLNWERNPMSNIQQKNKPRLGRGLSSLISISELPQLVDAPPAQPAAAPITPETTDVAPEVHSQAQPAPSIETHGPSSIPLPSIIPTPHQPRRVFDDSSLAQLAEAIKSSGVIQ